MRPNLPFLSAASNALLKPGGPLKWKKRLVKLVRLSLQLTEVMMIVRLISPLPDVPRLSSPRPRLRHGRRLVLLPRPKLTLYLCPLSLALSLILLPHLTPLLTSRTVLLPRQLALVFTDYLRSHFSNSQLNALPCRAEATCPSSAELRALRSLTFCFFFSSAEFLAGATNLSSSTATGPDKVAYPMSKHLLRSGMDFLLQIFNLSWSLPSIWKTFSIIPIHKMGKPIDSPASFRPISLTCCVSKLFECIILSRLLFVLESNSILSLRQAGFRPEQSTLDQILFLSQSISDGFNKPRPGSRTILTMINFSKAFNSVWHPALFNKLISAGVPPYFARWTQSFLSDRRACVVFQNQKSRSFRVCQVISQRSVLGPVLFSLFINDLLASLPSSVSCSLYADNLAIWSSSSRSPLRWRPHKELCFDWISGLSTGVFLSIRPNMRLPSFQWIPTKLNSSPTSSYSTPASVSIQLLRPCSFFL